MTEILTTDRPLTELQKIIARLPVRESSPDLMPRQQARPRGYESAVADQIPADQRNKIRQACVQGQWPMLLSGSVGSGKTCAAACVYGCFGRLPLWYRADDLLMQIGQARSGTPIRTECTREDGTVVVRELPYAKWETSCRNRSAIFLDDLGVRAASEAMRQSLFDLLEWRKGQPLVITSNKSLSELAAMYDDRIADRIAAGTVVRFVGPSRRQRGK